MLIHAYILDTKSLFTPRDHIYSQLYSYIDRGRPDCSISFSTLKVRVMIDFVCNGIAKSRLRVLEASCWKCN